MRKITTAALAATSIVVATATANATPPPAAGDTAVHYEVTRQGDAAQLKISGGEMKAAGNQLVLTDRDDRLVAAIPLTYRIDDTAYPIDARIDGATATLTPRKNEGKHVQAVARDRIVTTNQVATQVAESVSPRDSQALGTFAQRATIGAAISAVLGAVLGAGVGCLVGAAAGAALTSPVIVLLVPFVGATIAGCVLGVATIGAVGSMIGLVAAGGPILLFAAIQYFSTILSPCPPNTAACKDPAQAAAPAK